MASPKLITGTFVSDKSIEYKSNPPFPERPSDAKIRVLFSVING